MMPKIRRANKNRVAGVLPGGSVSTWLNGSALSYRGRVQPHAPSCSVSATEHHDSPRLVLMPPRLIVGGVWAGLALTVLLFGNTSTTIQLAGVSFYCSSPCSCVLREEPSNSSLEAFRSISGPNSYTFR